ncbi:MAG: 30S ribosomal protein S21 [Patescibacteria group bacterium]
MIQVTKKDSKESVENLIRRFTRKVQQAGVVTTAKSAERFEKPLSKRDRRQKAIVRRERKAIKMKKIKMGLAPPAGQRENR